MAEKTYSALHELFVGWAIKARTETIKWVLLPLAVLSLSGCGSDTNDGLPDMGFLNHADVLEMQNGLLEAFPPGTPRNYVEKALIEKGGAKYESEIKENYNFPHEKNTRIYSYKKPIYLRFLHNGRYIISIYYDENDHVKHTITAFDGRSKRGISISGPTGL